MKKYLMILMILLTSGCDKFNREQKVDKQKLLGYDYRLFQQTHYWEIAKAVSDDDHDKIQELLSNEESLINAQDPLFGHSLLMFTIWHDQYETFRFLLKKGANPNIYDRYNGRSSIIEACEKTGTDLKYIKILLDYGAKVNDLEIGKRREGNSTRYTPLMAASREGKLEIVKYLIAKGADVNFQNEYKQTALSHSVLQERYQIVVFLLIKGADHTQPILYRPGDGQNYKSGEDKPVFLVDLLREDFFELGTEEYKSKMQIVDFLKSKGVDYKKAPIPDFIREKAKEEYPNTWRHYLENY